MDDKLIKEVQKRAVLYDSGHKLYRNNKVRRQMWTAVAKELNSTVELCQLRWKRIRDKYSRLTKRSVKNDEGGTLKKNSSLMASLNFLKPFILEEESFDLTSQTDESASLKQNISTLKPNDIEQSSASIKLQQCPSIALQSTSTVAKISNPVLVTPVVVTALQTMPNMRSKKDSKSPNRLRAIAPKSEIKKIVFVPTSSCNFGLSIPNQVSPLRLEETQPKCSEPATEQSEQSAQETDTDRIVVAPKESYDTFDYYGLTVANDLRGMDPSEQRRIRMEIQVILANARYKN